VQGKSPVVLGRHEAYIGVMIDDLVTLGTKEPYRMFTSRAEYRLLLREDNADLRLSGLGHEIGLLPAESYTRFSAKREQIAAELERIKVTRISMADDEQQWLEQHHCPEVQKGTSLEQLLRRPEIGYAELAEIYSDIRVLPPQIREQVEIQVKYQGYIERQEEQVERMRKMESTAIPPGFSYEGIQGLTTEVREKLERFRPDTLGQASRIQGVTPAALAILSVMIKAGGGRG
jgi:tRNA uridine 5-carboxymethylaminomethyl modification enzyme